MIRSTVKENFDRLIAAIEFLTILPLGKSKIYDPKGMIPYFPIVGIVLGAMVSAFDHMAIRLWSPPVASVLDVFLLVVLTAALHLDGLGDTADGLFGHRSREKALTIMKDSRIGVMGLAAILGGLSLKWAGIASLDVNRTLLLIIIPAYARGSMLFGIRFLEYGRPGGGTGYDFFNDPVNTGAFLGLLVPIVLSYFLGWQGVWLNFFFAAITLTLLYYYQKRMGCITGDMLGAMVEINEALLFLLVSIRGF